MWFEECVHNDFGGLSEDRSLGFAIRRDLQSPGFFEVLELGLVLAGLNLNLPSAEWASAGVEKITLPELLKNVLVFDILGSVLIYQD